MNEIINDFRPEIRSLLKAFTDAGFALDSGNNGEYEFKFSGNFRKFVDDLDATDESHLRVSKGGKSTWLFLVLGNSPGELVSDYGYLVGADVAEFNSAVDAIVDAHYEKWQSRGQPKTTRSEKYGNK
jgi:hypothetical protein